MKLKFHPVLSAILIAAAPLAAHGRFPAVSGQYYFTRCYRGAAAGSLR